MRAKQPDSHVSAWDLIPMRFWADFRMNCLVANANG